MGRPEDSRVKIPALVHFTRLGYTYMSIKDIYNLINSNTKENVQLITLRDWLLPMLMNGQATIED